MKNTILFLLLIIGAISSQGQVLVKMSPKVEKPKVAPAKPKTVVKTKIVYLEKPAPATQPEATNSFEPELVFVAGGTFQMGSNVGFDDDKPIHTVTINSFKMGKYEVTVAQYKAYCKASGTEMPTPPSWGWKDSHPIANIDFSNATAYCNWLSDKTLKDYRLPTEAEWEFAARGGNSSSNYTYSGSGSDNLEAVAWYDANSGGETQASGKKRPNELGIYDMSGNVWEWCKDWYSDYSIDAKTNPRGTKAGSVRIVRGGGYDYGSPGCRVASRFKANPNNRDYSRGFRVVLSQ